MRSTLPIRLHIARFAPVLAGVALVVSSAWTGNSVTLSATDGQDDATLAVPAARATALGLPMPVAAPDVAHQECAGDVMGAYPLACFADRASAEDYIAGRSRRADSATTLTLSGFGGTTASLTGNPAVGRTCTGSGCTGTITTWYSTTGANCTHAYPYNDYFKENVSTFYYAQNLSTGVSNLNCNRMILYRDATQGGGGALDCGSTTSPCGSGSIAYQSISWHNG